MLFFICMGIGVVWGLFSKKKSFKVEKTNILYLILAIQLFPVLLGLKNLLLPSEVISLVLILYVLYYNYKELSISVIGIGFILNLITMISNNGQMPVKTLKVISDSDIKHCVLTNLSNLKWFSDIIYLPYPLGRWMVVSSIGDLIVAVGLMILCKDLVSNYIKI